MKPIVQELRQLFSVAFQAAFPSLKLQEPVLAAANPRFGDYQVNNAMGIHKQYGQALGFATAQKVGEAIRDNLPANTVIAPGSVTVAPAGFVTVKLCDEWIAERCKEVVRQGVQIKDPRPRRVAVDFSSPNIAKEMHVGHLRSTIIGDSLCRILEFVGHEVLRLNHVGDWGTQFGMLIEHIKDNYPDFKTKPPPISDLQAFYKEARKRFEADASFKERSQKAVVALQAGDKVSRDAWQLICDISRKTFQVIYDELGVKLTERGESFYNAMIPPIIAELTDRGIVEESRGAKCIFTPVHDIPLMVQKGDGGFGYDSTDLAAVFHRLMVERCDWVVYITDMGQGDHFHMIFAAAEMAGWHRAPQTRLDHMGFGLVLAADGKKFKTRSGDTVKLQDLLSESIERAEAELKRRTEEAGEDAADASQVQAAARKMGYGAVKYFDLKQNRTTDYAFSFDAMLDPKGNTAVYLMYAYARICAIFRKAGVERSKVDAGALKLVHPKEREVALQVLKLPEVIDEVLHGLHLSRLAEYVHELAKILSAFYAVKECKVIGSAEQASRLALLEATRKVFVQAFALLGIDDPLEKI